MSNTPKFNVNVDYVGSYCEKVGKEDKKDFNHPSNHIMNLKKALEPPMTNDDVVLCEDDVWAAFDDDFDEGQQANVIASNVLPPNPMHPIARTSRSNMA
jgi:hypothetical protein